MELREWAVSILSADSLEAKLYCPDLLTDFHPGPAIYWKEPSRPTGMGFQKHSKEDKLPPFHTHHLIENRINCLHRFAGHELLAVEVMAFALLAYPEAPATFRKGVANTLKEEQGHVKLYRKRLLELGINFGDLPLYRHFWRHTAYLATPIQYISMMSLTLEMANLDFAPLYGKSFERHGDAESAALMATILRDEISHVRFGWRWLAQFKQSELSEWQAWKEALPPIVEPKRAKGFVFNEEPRKQAGISLEWIQSLKEV